jgi:4-aminobutyrate aminotransferase-like enzyme
VARTRLVKPAADVVGQPPSGDGGLVRAYRERTPRSAAAFEAARRVLPGGETRAVTSYPPYPVIITEGHGARLTDADGHVYLDLVNNYTAMVHGSGFAPVTEAVAGLLPQGFAFASPHPHQVALAEMLAARVPSVQRVRFTNSGTEAALLAARIVARAAGGSAPGPAAQRRLHHPAGHDQPVHRAQPGRPRRHRRCLLHRLHAGATGRFMIVASSG